MRRAALALALSLSPSALGAQASPATLSVERLASGERAALVQNQLAGPLQVRVWDAARPREAITATLAEGESRALGRFDGRGAPDLRLQALPGPPMLLPPAQESAYAFPLPRGVAWRLTQGFGGHASHRDADNRHAIDLAAALGTPVLSARAGRVLQVIDHFREGGTDAALKDRANLIRVLHADGSMAVYAHLAEGSAMVRPGDTVTAGMRLGAVGSVGWSTAPHLHFVVQANDGEALLSLPFRMPVLADVAVADGRAPHP